MNEINEEGDYFDRAPFDLDAAIRDLSVGPTDNIFNNAGGSEITRYIKN